MIRVYHYKSLTKAERDRLNGPNGGWDSEPRFSRYADITGGFASLETYAKAFADGEYDHVATVAGDKDDAFRFTNHLDYPWPENENLVAAPGPHRSTSVGDIVVDTETGEVFVVARLGFDNLGLTLDSGVLFLGTHRIIGDFEVKSVA